MGKILVSACLAGIKCRYNGKEVVNQYVPKLEQSEIIKVCPEVLGGLETPREPCEIIGGTAEEVWKGTAKILSISGKDCTKQFKIGALKVLDIVRENNITKAVLKQRSPSCGYGINYDGTFSGNKINGNGILAELLKQNGVEIIPID